jgi:hypothetical protein
MPYVGTIPYPFVQPVTQISSFDDISSQFNGSTTIFNLTVGSVPYSHGTSKSLLVVLGGIVQKPNQDYTINSNQITFTTAPASGLSFEARHLYGIPVTYEETVSQKIIVKTITTPFAYRINAKDVSIVGRSATYNYVDLDTVVNRNGLDVPLQTTSTFS